MSQHFVKDYPQRSEYHEQYLKDAVHSFKLATSSVKDETQIHTHMCYSQFGQIIHAIHDLDADVISIETSRSHGDLIKDFEDINYDLGIGLGVYDIHSPRIPTEDEITTALFLQQIDRSLFWVNPDCGLKTRKEDEVKEALTVLVNAVKRNAKKIMLQQHKNKLRMMLMSNYPLWDQLNQLKRI